MARSRKRTSMAQDRPCDPLPKLRDRRMERLTHLTLSYAPQRNRKENSVAQGTRIQVGQRGDISTRKIRTGLWEATCYWRDNDATLKRKKRRAATEGEATKKLQQAFKAPSVITAKTTGELMASWLRQHLGVANSTREQYGRDLNRYVYPFLGQVYIADLDAVAVQDAINAVFIQSGPWGAKRARTLLKMGCAWATRMGLLDSNPVDSTVVPGGRSTRERPWAPPPEAVEYLRQLLKEDCVSPERAGYYSPAPWLTFEIILGTGCRTGEVCAADWEDLDWEEGTLTFRDTTIYEDGTYSKRGHLKNYDPSRTVHLPNWLQETLRPYSKETGPIIRARGGVRMSTPSLRRSWRRVYSNAGVPPEHRIVARDVRRAVGTKIMSALGTDAAASQLGNTTRVAERYYIAPTYAGPKKAAKVL